MKASGDENPESANFAVVGGETNESESLKVKEFVFDMDEALDVAMGNGQQIPAKADAPRVNHSDTMIDVTQSSGHSSLELFPLVLGGVLVVLGISFTAFVFHAVFKKKRDEQHEEPRCEDRDSKLKEKMNPMKHNSWVNGRYGTSLEMAEEGDAQSEAIPKVEDDNAILSWKDLSCTYCPRNLDERIS